MKGKHVSRASVRRAARAARVWVNFGGIALGPFPNQRAAHARIAQARGMFHHAQILDRHGEVIASWFGDLASEGADDDMPL